MGNMYRWHQCPVVSFAGVVLLNVVLFARGGMIHFFDKTGEFVATEGADS